MDEESAYEWNEGSHRQVGGCGRSCDLAPICHAHRRIVVRDCSETTFLLFLHYLYGGPLELDSLHIEAVVKLLAAADQYETSVLRGRCEVCLVGKVEDGTVFPLLQVADRYSARRLRVTNQIVHDGFCYYLVLTNQIPPFLPTQEVTLQHILHDPDVLMREVEGYSDLPDDLKQELRGLLSSQTNPLLLLHHTHPSGHTHSPGHTHHPGGRKTQVHKYTHTSTGTTGSLYLRAMKTFVLNFDRSYFVHTHTHIITGLQLIGQL